MLCTEISNSTASRYYCLKKESDNKGPNSTKVSPRDNFSEFLRESKFEIFGVRVKAGNGVIVIDLEKQVPKLSKKLEEKLNQLYQDNDIDTSYKAEFEINKMGKVIVTNNHPQKEEIENLINNNREVRNLFVHLSNATYTRDNMRRTNSFRQLYASNPQLAVQRHSYIFNGERKFNFELLFKDGQLTKESNLEYV